MKTRLAAFVQECCRIPRLFATISELALIFSILLVTVGIAEAATQTTTLTISGQSNVVISGMTISTTSGDCIDIVNSTNVTIQASQIGPCGTNNTTNSSKGISITGGNSINIYDNYIHVDNLASSCSDSHDGILINGTNGPVTMQGNVIAFNENNVRVWNSSNITANGNFLLNTRGAAACSSANNLQGHSIQFWADNPAAPNTNITVSNNYVLASSAAQYAFPPAASDYINFGFTNGVVAQNNWVGGDPAHTNQFACGLIADDAVNSAQFTNNIVSNTYNCGIAIASGTNQMVSGNKVLLAAPTTGWATGIVIEGNDYPSVPCGPVSVSNNIAYAVQSSGWLQSYYDDNHCTSVTLTGNTWDQAAYNILAPITSTNPPPLIPPQPFSCVATSPYSTQTSAQPCSGSGSPPPHPTATLTANPTSISSGQSSKLTWNSTNATACSGAGFTASGVSGSATVTPTSTSTYSLTCNGSGGSTSANATVTVTAPPPPPTAALTANPASISSGQSSTLTWSSTNATACSSPNFSASGSSGSVTVTPAATSTYSVTCSGSGGSANASATVTVTVPPPPPPTAALTANPISISSGQSSTLTWSSTNATSCSSPNFGASGSSGSVTVTPAATSTYSVTCSGSGGSANASATVTVTVPPPPPTAALAANPASISSGQSSTLTWSSTNATSCSSPNFSASGSSGSVTVTPAATSTYSVTCRGGGGSASANATVALSKSHGKHH